MRATLLWTCLFAASTAGAGDLTVTVLDRNGKPLPDAVVLVDSSVQGARPAPVLEARVVQEKLRFVPAVTVVGLGAKLSFSNLDGWDHHVILGVMGAGGVYLDPGQNTQFRLAARVAGRPPAMESKVLSQSGPYLLGCHIHGSMRGHVYVADTPWARLGGGDGTALLQGLPDGPARVRVWHADQLVEGSATPVQIVTAGSAVTVRTQIVASRKRPAAAADSYIGL